MTRQPIEWEQLLVILGRRRIASVHTVREGERDVAEGGGRMVTRIMAAVDAEYTEVTRVRIRRALRQLAAEGRPCGGRLFGYVSAVDDDGRKTRAIVPHEAEAVRWAAAELLRGETLASVARAFDAKGMAHVRKGKAWSPTHIRSLVTNPTVAGMRPDPRGTSSPPSNRPFSTPPPGGLSEPSWRNRSRGSARTACCTARPASGPSRRHLLSAGLAFCGVCGAPLGAQVRKRTLGTIYVSYVCNPRLGRVCVGIVDNFLEPLKATLDMHARRSSILSPAGELGQRY